MPNILYTLLIFPIEQIIELCYVSAYRIFRNPGLSIIGMSIAVSTLILPLYFMAEKKQQAERDKRSQMKRMTDKIKAVFKGDEQYMMLSTLYRQNNYHPLYVLRGNLSLFIQVPFFIAAYHFLSNLDLINGLSFGPISNLSKPDSILRIGSFSFNLLPILMTLINLVSTIVYSKETELKDKIQLYFIPGIFLVLLYNSPSALVLYWTFNNLFSLFKNLIIKTKNPKKITWVLFSISCVFISFYSFFFRKTTSIEKRLIYTLIPLFIPYLTYLINLLLTKYKLNITKFKIKNTSSDTVIFILSLIILFLLTGLLIPSSLISSSVQEFSFTGANISPFPFILNTMLKSFGIFIIYPLLIFLLFSRSAFISIPIIILSILSIVNVFIFPGNFGFLTIDFLFSEPINPSILSVFLNLFVMASSILLLLFLLFRYKKLTVSFLIILIFSCIISSSINIKNIYKEFRSFQAILLNNNMRSISLNEPVYNFSKTGNNVLIIMLDRGISGYIPYIFEEKPELHDSYKGFIWYNNTISFGNNTSLGVPGLFGGYEYTPLEIQRRDNIPLVQKHNESLLLLPLLFSEHGYDVSITEPPLANHSFMPDLSIFDNYPRINANNILGKYNDLWLLNNENTIRTFELTDIIEYHLIRFSFFRITPIFLKRIIYDRGDWWRIKIFVSAKKLNNYIVLDILSRISFICENGDKLNIINNELTHNPFFLQAPSYYPSNTVTNIGEGPFAHEENYHVNLASLLLLGKFFDFLKENMVYDNTRIIIVSDHGRNLKSNFPDNIILPNGHSLQFFNALLLVKDFNSNNYFSTNDSFMTNADVPLIAIDGIIDNPVNPFTGKDLNYYDKSNGVIITTSSVFNVNDHFKYQFNIKHNQWMRIHTNIFDPSNWSIVENP